MSSIGPNIGDEPVPVEQHQPTSGVNGASISGSNTHSAISSIMKSEAIASLLAISANFPLLPPPNENIAFRETALLAILKSEKAEQEIISRILDDWSKNLQEMEDQVRRMINSPEYLIKQDILIHGDPNQAQVSGIINATAANSAEMNPNRTNDSPYDFMSALEKMRAMERLSTSESGSSSHSTDRPSVQPEEVLPVMAMVAAGGGIALGITEVTTTASGMSSNVMTGPMQLVEQLTPAIPQMSMTDVIPYINLMISIPIYTISWNEAVLGLKDKGRQSAMQVAEKFAQDVIKMVSDPAFVMVNFVNKMQGSEQLDEKGRGNLAAMMKLILSSVALAMLYSAEVGKMKSGKFWGMEPQEFKDLLAGTLAAPDPSKQPTPQQRLAATLMMAIRYQLDALPEDVKAGVLESILNYIGSRHSVDSMMEPLEVFNQVLSPDYDATSTALKNTPA